MEKITLIASAIFDSLGEVVKIYNLWTNQDNLTTNEVKKEINRIKGRQYVDEAHDFEIAAGDGE